MYERVLIHTLELVGFALVGGTLSKLLVKSRYGRALLPQLVTFLMILVLLGTIALIVLVPDIWRKALAAICSLVELWLLVFWVRIIRTPSQRNS